MKKLTLSLALLSAVFCADAGFVNGGKMISKSLSLSGFGDIVNQKSGLLQATDMVINGKFANEGTVIAENVLNVLEKCASFESAGTLQAKELRFASEKTAIKLSPKVLVAALYKGNNNLGGIVFEAKDGGKATLIHTTEKKGKKTFVCEVAALEKILQEGLSKAQNADELGDYLQKNA